MRSQWCGASIIVLFVCLFIFFFKQKTAYEMRISDWSSDVCSSDLRIHFGDVFRQEAVSEQRAEPVRKVDHGSEYATSNDHRSGRQHHPLFSPAHGHGEVYKVARQPWAIGKLRPPRLQRRNRLGGERHKFGWCDRWRRIQPPLLYVRSEETTSE